MQLAKNPVNWELENNYIFRAFYIKANYSFIIDIIPL